MSYEILWWIIGPGPLFWLLAASSGAHICSRDRSMRSKWAIIGRGTAQRRHMLNGTQTESAFGDEAGNYILNPEVVMRPDFFFFFFLDIGYHSYCLSIRGEYTRKKKWT